MSIARLTRRVYLTLERTRWYPLARVIATHSMIRGLTSGEALALLLDGVWIEGNKVHAANLSTMEQALQRV